MPVRIALVGCRAVGSWPVAPTADDPRPWERDDRPLHAALRERGATVATPAWDDPDVDWGRFDLAVPRATWDYHHHRDRFVAWAEAVERRTRLVNPARIVRWNTDKRYLRDLAVPQPETVWIPAGSTPHLGSVLRSRGWDRALLKPAVGATAEGTLRFDLGSVELAERHLATWAAGTGADFLLQPYLAGVETLGERSAIAIGGEITHFVRKVPVPGDYRVQDDWGATDEPHEPSDAEQELARSALDAVGERLAYARVDWLPSADGPLLVELELVEPCLFFRHGAGAAERLAEVLLASTGG